MREKEDLHRKGPVVAGFLSGRNPGCQGGQMEGARVQLLMFSLQKSLPFNLQKCKSTESRDRIDRGASAGLLCGVEHVHLTGEQYLCVRVSVREGRPEIMGDSRSHDEIIWAQTTLIVNDSLI